MLVSTWLTRVSYALRGTDDDAPSIGTDEANYWLDTLNRKKDELYEDVSILWRIAYKSTAPNEPGTVATTGTTTLTGTGTNFNDYAVGDKIVVSGETVRTIATITSDMSLTVTVAFSNTASGKSFTRQTIIATGVEDYNLHRKFLAPAERVHVTDTDSHRHFYDVIQPQEKDYTSKQVYISGSEPQILTFTEDTESTEQIVGGTLFIPGYYLPDDVSTATDTIPLPDPNWGVMAVAAEIAFNDIVYEDKAEGLNGKANYLYSLMAKKNRRGTHNNPRTVPKSYHSNFNPERR
jgi:hypothetical protein